MLLISEKIKIMRSLKKLSQDAFVRPLGYSRAYLADIETGRAMPSRRFLETFCSYYGVPIDWVYYESKLVDLVDQFKGTENPAIIFIYAFTQEGIEKAGKKIKEIFSKRKLLLVDASGIKTQLQFFKKITNKPGSKSLLFKKTTEMMLNEEIILIVKNLSSSKIPDKGHIIKDIFKAMDDAWDTDNLHKLPKSSLLLLDYPSFLERNMDLFGYYVEPFYLGRSDPWQPIK